jgi:hypothetical protein
MEKLEKMRERTALTVFRTALAAGDNTGVAAAAAWGQADVFVRQYVRQKIRRVIAELPRKDAPEYRKAAAGALWGILCIEHDPVCVGFTVSRCKAAPDPLAACADREHGVLGEVLREELRRRGEAQKVL